MADLTQRLAFLISAQDAGASATLNKIGDSARTQDTKVAGLNRALGSTASVLAGVGVAAFAVEAGQAASRLEQSVGATTAVFKESAAEVDEFAKKSAEAVGLAEAEFRELAAVSGASFKNLGQSTDEAAKNAIQLVQIGADLAAQYGGSTKDAVNALNAAFRGEADPAERYALRLNQTTVNAKALELGLAKTTSQVSASAKAQATMALILEQSADAIGTFGRESDSAAGAQQRANAAAENAKAAFGQAMAPAMAFAFDKGAQLLGVFNELPESIQATIGTIGLVGAGVGTLVRPVSDILNIVTRLSDARKVSAAATAAETAAITGNTAASVANLYAKAASGAASMAGKIGIATVALVALKVGFDKAADSVANYSAEVEGFKTATDEQLREHLRFAQALGKEDELLNQLLRSGNEGVGAISRLRDIVAETGGDTSKYDAALGEAKQSQDNLNESARRGEAALKGVDAASDDTTEALKEQREALDKANESAKTLQGTYEEITSKTLGEFNAALAESDAAIATRKALDDLANLPTEQAERNQQLAESVADASERLAEAQRSLAEAQAATGTGTADERAAALKRVESAERAVADAADSLADARERQARETLTAQEAEDELQRATNNALSAILDQAEAHRKAYEATVEASGGTVDAAESNRRLVEELTAVRDTLDEGSPLRSALDGYIARLQNVPTAVFTELQIKYSETGDVTILRALIDAQTKAAAEALGMTTEEYYERERQREIAGGTGARASGGPVWPGTWLVGEDGPEILRLGMAGYVHNNTETRQMLGGNTSSTYAPNITQQFYGRMDPEETFAATARGLRRLAYLARPR